MGGPRYPPSLFRISHGSSDVTLVNLISFDMVSTLAGQRVGTRRSLLQRRDISSDGGGAEGVMCDPPDAWISVFEQHNGQNTTTTKLDRPLMYRRT